MAKTAIFWKGLRQSAAGSTLPWLVNDLHIALGLGARMEAGAFLKELIAGNGNWISLILAFAILPSLYMRLAFDMQKEFVDIAKTVASNINLSRPNRVLLTERSEQALQAFQLEWGLVCAIAVLVLANFSTSFLVDLSAFVKNANPSYSIVKVRLVMEYAFDQTDLLDATIGNPQYYKVCKTMFCGTAFESAKVDGSLTQPSITGAQVKSFLSVYSIVIVLLIFFQISWTRLVAMQRLRRIYLELGQNERRPRVPIAAPHARQR
jgi:hypothetical protein